MRELWVPLSGAIAQQRNVETIANNVANINTPGFKRDQVVFKEYLAALEKGGDQQGIDLPQKEWKPEDFYRSYNAEDSFVKVDGSYTVHEQGQLAQTGNFFDNALSGPGFYEVLTPNGVRFSRNGAFSISNDGKLVTDQGFLVLSKDAPPIATADGKLNLATAPESRAINIGTGKFSVSLDGEVFNGQNKVGDLALTEFNDIHALRKEGNNLFINPDQKNIKVGESKTSVHQGFVEQSNVNAVGEMSNLINANRNFESIQRVIKTYDTMSAKAVNEISKF
ncbi:flagellar hook-basal body protein [Bacteriovorax sp. PP10]|uniref:Flagellar hook-basal body protein n=1 Tax=Bacteriovorax antarcticus TaxID=3088717 RepID=A0ABU5VTB3_9BACT|nr:flagellar hook-basal body protein [Bacteriovorax sp. PP10]MEA9354900.1 flagellar hook-basal body protein [Bacteriovorax sp. PP10]